jgi:hypothetical protein
MLAAPAALLHIQVQQAAAAQVADTPATNVVIQIQDTLDATEAPATHQQFTVQHMAQVAEAVQVF